MIKLFGDKIIWWISILLCIASVLLVYSSGGASILITHITHLIMGVGLIFIFSRFNFRYFTNLSTILLISSILMLSFLIIFPEFDGNFISSLKGRWINFGIFTFQPSELAKYSLILFLCRNLFIHSELIYKFYYLLLYILLPTALTCFLIIPFNLSTVILILLIVIFLIFISGYPINLFFKFIVLPSFVLITIFFSILILPNNPISDKLPRLTTWKNRICSENFNYPPLSLVDCSSYDFEQVYNNNYQIDKALSAVNRGGYLGSGAGDSFYKKILPDSISDFIFAILLEEYGLFGGVSILLIYLLFYQRIIILSVKSNNDFSRLILLGLGTVILFQALLHMCVSVNLIPVTGQTLPLVSRGGSSIWVTSLAFGIILNISYQINNQTGLK